MIEPSGAAEAAASASVGSEEQRVVFFDGVCALCDRSVRFLVARDRGGILKFAPLQGESAKRMLEPSDLQDDGDRGPQSMIYVRDTGGGRQVLTRSDASLAILRDLGGAWRVLALARIVPRPLRDAVYRLVARYRYRWFGRFESCRLPTVEEADRFLD